MSGSGISRAYLSGLAYSLGKQVSVENLAAHGVAGSEIEILRGRGFYHFLKDERPSSVMCIDSATMTMAAADAAPDTIDAVILANCGTRWTDFDELAFLGELHRIGIADVPVYGLALQACSAACSAVRLASCLIGEPTTRNILVIVFGRVANERSRPDANSLFSDGAASFLITSIGGDFEILRSELSSAPSLTQHELFGLQYTLQSYTQLRDRYSAAFHPSVPGELTRLFPTNTNLATAMLIAEAAEVDMERLHTDGMARDGHVFGCDPLIGLRDYTLRERPLPGALFALVGWSPYVFGVTILRASDSGAKT